MISLKKDALKRSILLNYFIRSYSPAWGVTKAGWRGDWAVQLEVITTQRIQTKEVSRRQGERLQPPFCCPDI